MHLCGTDTDSFFLAIYTKHGISLSDVHEEMKDVFDSSNYHHEHRLYSLCNKAKLGCFKDEAAGNIIKEFILLRPKMYSMDIHNSNGIRKAKGVKKHIVQKLTHSAFQDVYNNTHETVEVMANIVSKNHVLRTRTFRKRSLSLWEDKRFWVDKNFSVPYGFEGIVPPPSKKHKPLPPSGDI